MPSIDTAYRFIIEKATLAQLETWLYNTPELADLWGADLYFALIDINFKAKWAHHEARALLRKQIEGPDFEEWRLIGLLESVAADGSGALQALASIWDEYNDGYYFLDNLALGYSLSAHDQETGGPARLNESHDPALMAEAALALGWLRHGQVKLTGYVESLGLKSFQDYRSDADRAPRHYTFRSSSEAY